MGGCFAEARNKAARKMGREMLASERCECTKKGLLDGQPLAIGVLCLVD